MRLLLCLFTGMLFMLAGCSAMKHRHAAWHAGRDRSRPLVQATVMLSSGKEGDLLTVPSDKVLVITQVCGYGQIVLPTGPTGLYAQGGTAKTGFVPGSAGMVAPTGGCPTTGGKEGAFPARTSGRLRPTGPITDTTNTKPNHHPPGKAPPN